MTDLEARPVETPVSATEKCGPVLRRIESREVPLGGVRGITVHRTLPERTLPMVGAWCFLDHFAAEDHRMELLPHPHIGLQTVTWPLRGAARHRDGRGSDVVIRPGQLNLMTSGAGIAHSEFTPGDDRGDIEALQMWVALPREAAVGGNGFEQHTALPRYTNGAVDGVVLLGELDGVRSPATVFTPIVGAELWLAPGATAELPLRPEWEHAVLLVDGALDVDGESLEAGPLLYLGRERRALPLRNDGETPQRFWLLGGEPFAEDLIMWWNFVGRSHEEIVQAREDWEARSGRFALVAGHGDARIPAPPLPGVRLTPRRRDRPAI